MRKMLSLQNINAGGLILLNKGGAKPLQYVANTAFLASLFVDYMNTSGVPGFYCGPTFIALDVLRTFATSQVLYPFPSFSRPILHSF